MPSFHPTTPDSRLVLIITLWLKSDDRSAFEEFERRAAAIMERHGGRIERAIRIDGERGDPFEVHIVTFPDEQSFVDYRNDPAAVELAAERERIIERTTILRGRDGASYL